MPPDNVLHPALDPAHLALLLQAISHSGKNRAPCRGNPGQHRNLKRGVSELKIDVGPGYRVYYTRRQGILIILLCGGDKSTQRADIRLAYELVEELEL